MALRRGTLSLVLLDIKIPKLDGAMVIRDLVDESELATTSGVMLTSACEEGDMRTAGVSAFVIQPSWSEKVP